MSAVCVRKITDFQVWHPNSVGLDNRERRVGSQKESEQTLTLFRERKKKKNSRNSLDCKSTPMQGGGGMWKLHQHSQFFFSLRPDPPSPLIGYNFPIIHVFSQFLHKKRSFSIHSEIVFMLHFVPVELMMALVTLL